MGERTSGTGLVAMVEHKSHPANAGLGILQRVRGCASLLSTMQSSRPASTSTRPPVSPLPRNRAQDQVNTQTNVIDTAHGRILCVADIRGRLSALNDLARESNAKAIIHTGDFGFFGALPAFWALLQSDIVLRIQ